jgi:hypothetical protein
MQNILVTLLVVLALACQAVAQNVATHDTQYVVSNMLFEPYVAAFLSLILLITTLI